MLTRLVIGNFKSFDEVTDLNMVSSSKIRTKADHRVAVSSSLKLLRHAVIYGANASGKSNLIDCVSFFIEVVSKELPVSAPKLYCRNSEENRNKDSLFEIQMELDGRFYAFGFKAFLSERRISGEWLYELHPSGKSTAIYERESGKPPVPGKGLKLNEEEKQRFSTYAADFADNMSGLFLNELNRGKKYQTDSGFSVFSKIYRWIREKIVVITPDSRFINFQQYYNAESLSEINRLIRTFDTGVSDIHIEETDTNELEKLVPPPVLRSMMDTLLLRQKENPDVPAHLSGRSDNAFFSIELNQEGDVKVKTIRMKHGKSICDFDFNEESDGTRRLFDLMDMLLKKEDDTVFFVDELERSLHPKLTEHFLELFSEHHAHHKVQLIFTTHEASIMDQKLFRRDEFWFIERDRDNNSKLYSLDMFKERYDKKLSKAYLEGRYGAIPVFKRLDSSGSM
ncbi:MAG: ATP/GTP-binding protein [Bullifex sp.]